jgi:glycosyltransferase involved in cell wall biosynthesis
MLIFIQVIWFTSILVLLLYHLVIFRFKTQIKNQEVLETLPGVSVIIPVRNGLGHLRQFLFEIVHQDYPQFEVIIVDDHSDPEERKNLEDFLSFWPEVKLGSSKDMGKKHALTEGIRLAEHDFVLLTDADCKPACEHWIKTMVGDQRNTTVLGYSPHQKFPGWLNRFIRFETIMTGIQYLSWAMKGRPYMSVGRNVLYPKSLLVSELPFLQSKEIPFGDDDIGFQALSGKSKVNICIDKNAHVFTLPATSLAGWLKQKHRHLSAAHYYKAELWWQPAVFGLALILHWLLLPFMINSLDWRNWVPVFVIAILIRWINYIKWTAKLSDTDTNYWYPLLEVIYAAYLAFMGLTTLLVKKKTWN